MMRLTLAPNAAIAILWADALCQAGLPATVQRLYLGAAAGQLPPDQCLPEVWMDDERHVAAANDVLAALANLPQRRWDCAACGEVVDGGFDRCWSCGAAMPAGVKAIK